MKKKVFFSFAIVAFVMSLMACGNKGDGNAEGAEKAEPEGAKLSLCDKTYKGDSLMVSVDLWYPENAGVMEIEQFGTNYAHKVLADSAENYKLDFRFHENTTYKENKKVDAERSSESFKEFKIGDYDAYAYDFGTVYHVVVLFENISETTDRYLNIEIMRLMGGGDPDGKAFFEQNEEVKSIINSMRYNGVVKRTIEFKS